MFWVLGLAFLIVPIFELFLAIQVADVIGGWYTIATLVLISVVGAWLVRREGVGLLTQVQAQLRVGRMPTDQLVDGLLVLVAATLMLTPGYLTDATGLLLLVPFTRIPIRRLVIRRFRQRMADGRLDVGFGAFGPGGFGPEGFGGGGAEDYPPGFGGPGFGRRPRRVYDVDGAEAEIIDDDYPELPSDG